MSTLLSKSIVKTDIDFSSLNTQQLKPFACILDNIFTKDYCDDLIEYCPEKYVIL